MSDFEQEHISEESEYLSYRVLKDGDTEQLVEPFLKIRTLRAWRDIWLSFTEWFFNRRGWAKSIMGALAALIGYLMYTNLNALIGYNMDGTMLGASIAAALGYAFSHREYSGIISWMVSGHKTYLQTTIQADTGVPKMPYVEATLDEFAMLKVPKNIINKGRIGPSARGIQIHRCYTWSQFGKDYYFANWHDRTKHIFIGGEFSLSAFFVGIASLDKTIITVNRKFKKMLRKAEKISNDAKTYVDNGMEMPEKLQSRLPKAEMVLEIDRKMRKAADNLAGVIDEAEDLIGKNPYKYDVRKLSKYTRRYLIAASTYELNEIKMASRKDRISLNTVRERYNVAAALYRFYEIIPEVLDAVQRQSLFKIYAILHKVVGQDPEKIEEALALVDRRAKSLIDEPRKEKPQADVVITNE